MVNNYILFVLASNNKHFQFLNNKMFPVIMEVENCYKNNKIYEMVDYIVQKKPKFIKTTNSYDRKIVYKALEEILLIYNLKIKCNRSKQWVSQFAKKTMCYKHKCELTGACDCCSDPWCNGPNCEQCGKWEDCRFAVEKGDFMYKSKICVGINLFYECEKIKEKKLFKNK